MVCLWRIYPSVTCRILLVNIRLTGVNSSDQMGRVEFSLNGVWGTICDDTWNIHNAHVICGMMGLPSAIAALGSAVFGRGKGVIWLDTLNCFGNESSVLECQHDVFGNVKGCNNIYFAKKIEYSTVVLFHKRPTRYFKILFAF